MRIHRFLNAGVLTREGRVEPTAEGTPQGGPLSPLCVPGMSSRSEV